MCLRANLNSRKSFLCLHWVLTQEIAVKPGKDEKSVTKNLSVNFEMNLLIFILE